MEYPKEQERGYASNEDLYVPGYFEMPIKKGESIVFSGSTSQIKTSTLKKLWDEEVADRKPRDNFYHILLCAAHQFHFRDRAVTWMNSTANGRPVVPRSGYIVEFNALWYNALKFCALMAAEKGDAKGAEKLEALAQKTKASFVETFVNEYGYLLDYVDGNMMDWSVRPNMIFAVALDYSPLSQEQMKSVVDICTRELLTPKGLRSLSPKSGGYNPMYVGPQTQRDYAYHQGTAWPWLGGFYMEACLKLYKRSRLSFIERQLVGYEDEMDYHAIGTISELFDGNPPFHGRGAMSFAMNVAEILRTLKLIDKYSYQK